MLEQIGVPQGGSLSTLIANAVLHAADRAVLESLAGRHITYLRYCDDMILLSPSAEVCEEAFQCYQKALQKLCLPIHEAKPLQPYRGSDKRKFWAAKSRPVYHWAGATVEDSFPWIQFLGYQIRFDGLLRVRPSSIAKERMKVTRVTDRLLRSLRPENVPNLRRSAAAIKHRLRMKLIAMAVGRRDLGQSLVEPLPKCWVNGFRWLAGKPVFAASLKALDRHRERQINRVARRLGSLHIPAQGRRDRQETRRKFYGFPYSYAGQFEGTS